MEGLLADYRSAAYDEMVDAQGLHRITGRPFMIAEVEEKILSMVN